MVFSDQAHSKTYTWLDRSIQSSRNTQRKSDIIASTAATYLRQSINAYNPFTETETFGYDDSDTIGGLKTSTETACLMT